MCHWLVKTEPSQYSIDDLKRDSSTEWTGVRNFQARNFLQAMKPGDMVLVYHSNAEPSAVVGVGRVATEAAPDPTQFDKKSEYFDPKATKDKPKWFAPQVKFVEKFRNPLPIELLRNEKKLAELELLRRGSRLSVHPLTEEQFKIMSVMGQK